MEKHYYEIHIFLGRDEGYSCFFESEKNLEDEDEIIEEALILVPTVRDDIDMCDYAMEISSEEFLNSTGKDE